MKKNSNHRKTTVVSKTRYKKVALYDRFLPANDYLKNYRVVKYWAMKNYNVTGPELEMMYYLYGEGLFYKNEFLAIDNVFSWDKNRFHKLMADGWIHIWRQRSGAEANLYELTFKGKKLINSIYKKLNGEEPIPESERRNVIFRSKKFSDKTYAIAIRRFNEDFRRLKLKNLEARALKAQNLLLSQNHELSQTQSDLPPSDGL